MKSSFVRTLVTFSFVSLFASCSLAGSLSTPLPGGCSVCGGGEDEVPQKDEVLYEAKSLTTTSGFFRLPQDHTLTVIASTDVAAGSERVEVDLRILQADGQEVQVLSSAVSVGNPVIFELPREQVSTAREPIFLQAQLVFKNLDQISAESYPVTVSVESGGVVAGASARSGAALDLGALPRKAEGRTSGGIVEFLCVDGEWLTVIVYEAQ